MSLTEKHRPSFASQIPSRLGSCLSWLFVAMLILMPAELMAQDKTNPKTEAVKPADDKHPLAELFSGYKYLSEDVRAIQDSDIANPGMAWYTLGEQLWNKPGGTQKKACADCHNEAKASMRGVAARYPVYDRLGKKMVNMEQRINQCREKFMKAEPLAAESDELVGLSIYVRGKSRGIPVKPRIEGPARESFDKGAAYFNQRRGQMNLSCANCHDQSFGKKVRATVLSQGQSNGFPVYSLEQEKPVILHRRFIMCNNLVRANPRPIGDETYVNLELYLAWRGEGLQIETPAVRY